MVWLSLGVLILAAYWFYRKQPEAEAPRLAASAPRSPAVHESSRPIETLPPEEAPRVQSEEDITALRARASTDFDLGLQTLKLVEQDGKLRIPVTFVAEKKWCQGGDLDTINYLRPDPESKEFLISLETLVGRRRGDKARVSSKELFAGFSKTLEIPINSSTEVVGLYLCRDQKNSGSCRDKDLKTHEQINDAIADSATMEAARAGDYQLYFQTFIIKDSVLMVYDNKNVSQQRADTMRRHLNEGYGVPIPDFNAAWNVNKVLRSLPAQIEGNKITLTMPYNDPRCTVGAPSIEP